MSDGIIIKTLRESSNLSQSGLSKLSGVSRSFISEIESDKAGFSEETFDKLSSALVKFVDLSYVAGMYDRKSSISILKVHKREEKTKDGGGWVLSDGYIARVEFTTKHELLAKFLSRMFDFGTVTKSKYKYGNNEYTRYSYMCWSKNAERLLTELLPYLKLKKKQAELILELRALQGERKGRSWGAPTKHKVDEDEFSALCEYGYGCVLLSRYFGIPEQVASRLKEKWLAGKGLFNNIEETTNKYLNKVEEYERIYQELQETKRILN